MDDRTVAAYLDRRLIRTRDGARTERLLRDDAEVLAAYRDLFGIALDRVPPQPDPESDPAPAPGQRRSRPVRAH